MSLGWSGKILRIDLSTGKSWTEDTGPYTHSFIGGKGITVVIDYTKCHGCRQCETVCAMISGMNKGGTFKPRVISITWELEGWEVPIICQQCQTAPCMAVCPNDAIYRHAEFSRIMVNYDCCIGCRICMAACPFGAMDFDVQLRRVIKCDLCDDDPLCVKLCSYGALQYLDVNKQSIIKKTEVAQKLKEILFGRALASNRPNS